MQTHTITTTNYKFKIYIENDDGRLIYHLRGPKLECVTLEYADDVMVMQNLSHHTTCSLETTLKRHEGTIEMAKATIQYALSDLTKQDKKVDYVEFTDNSTFTCGKERVILSNYSFLTKGQTWYEKYFGATLKNSTKRKILNIARNKLYKKPTEKFDDLAKIVFNDLPNSQLTEIEKIYKESDTWLLFFSALDTKYKCDFLFKYIDFLSTIAGINLEYLHEPFMISSEVAYAYNEVKHIVIDGKKSGGRKTRKQTKRNKKVPKKGEMWPFGQEPLSHEELQECLR